MTDPCEYDLIVIVSGPAGEKAAIHAAYHDFKVAMGESSPSLVEQPPTPAPSRRKT